jgi:hypothetical protein
MSPPPASTVFEGTSVETKIRGVQVGDGVIGRGRWCTASLAAFGEALAALGEVVDGRHQAPFGADGRSAAAWIR